ncbi:MAG TPA: PmoA family protein [Verrucomicrobiales bacterium]|nr:PmoA family protein [Verrucomicrobiales bacterium]
MRRHVLSLAFPLFPVLLAGAFLPSALQADPRFEILAGDFDRPPGPVIVPLNSPPAHRLGIATPLRVVMAFSGSGTEKELQAQLIPTPSGTALAFITPEVIRAGTALPCRVVSPLWPPSEDEEAPSRISWRRRDTAVELLAGTQPVLAYHFETVDPPEGVTPLHRRSAFIHPLYSPAGAVLTDVSPPDHHHHYGIWHPWRQTVFEGNPLNFWELREAQGTIRFREFRRLWEGRVCGGFTARQEHVALDGDRRTTSPVLDEDFTVRVWNLERNDDPLWLIDYVTRQRCATHSPLELPAYRYGGGFAFRGAAGWNKETSGYLTSEGHNWENGDAQRSRWCRIHGDTEQGPASVLILNHPANHAFPQPMRINPANYVFFNYTPIRDDPWILEPGDDYVMRYRLVVANRVIESEEAETWWREYVEPARLFLHDP